MSTPRTGYELDLPLALIHRQVAHAEFAQSRYLWALYDHIRNLKTVILKYLENKELPYRMMTDTDSTLRKIIHDINTYLALPGWTATGLAAAFAAQPRVYAALQRGLDYASHILQTHFSETSSESERIMRRIEKQLDDLYLKKTGLDYALRQALHSKTVGGGEAHPSDIIDARALFAEAYMKMPAEIPESAPRHVVVNAIQRLKGPVDAQYERTRHAFTDVALPAYESERAVRTVGKRDFARVQSSLFQNARSAAHSDAAAALAAAYKDDVLADLTAAGISAHKMHDDAMESFDVHSKMLESTAALTDDLLKRSGGSAEAFDKFMQVSKTASLLDSTQVPSLHLTMPTAPSLEAAMLAWEPQGPQGPQAAAGAGAFAPGGKRRSKRHSKASRKSSKSRKSNKHRSKKYH